MAETDDKARAAPVNESSFPAPGVVLVSPARTVSFATPRALNLLACSQETSGTRLAAALSSLRGDGSSAYQVPLEFTDSAGRHRLRMEAHALSGGGGWLLLLEDVDKLEAQSAVLSDSVRAQMWKRLRPVLHHDFKAPIQSILWSLEILERVPAGADGEARMRDSLEVVRKETASLQARLQGLLDEIAPYDTESAIVDTGELMQHAAHLTRSECGLYGVDVELAAGARDLFVEGHRDDLKQALMTLLFVALDYLRDGGALTLVSARAGSTIELVVEGKATGKSRSAAKADVMAMPEYEVAARIAREHGGTLAMADRSSICFVMTLPAVRGEDAGA